MLTLFVYLFIPIEDLTSSRISFLFSPVIADIVITISANNDNDNKLSNFILFILLS